MLGILEFASFLLMAAYIWIGYEVISPETAVLFLHQLLKEMMVIFAVKLLKMLLKLLSIHLPGGEGSICHCFHGFGCSLTSSEKPPAHSHH